MSKFNTEIKWKIHIGWNCKKINQSRKQFKTKQITIQKMSTKFKNQITRDEIKNKIKLETTNVNKKITSKRREIESKQKDNWRAGLIFSMVCTQIQKEREGKEKKKSFSTYNHHTYVI